MKNKLTLLFFLAAMTLLCTGNIYSQSIERSVISFAGASYSGATFQSDFTVGEVITATWSNGNIKITQGFQQPAFSIICLGDFDNNGVINISDLLLFTGDFGCVSSCGNTDLDNNGAVNTADLLLFLSVFGTLCS